MKKNFYKINIFFKKIDSLLIKNPVIAFLCIYDFYRHLYLNDPYHKYEDIKDPFKRLNYILDRNISLIRQLEKISFVGDFNKKEFERIFKIKNFQSEKKIGNVYNHIWSKFDLKDILNARKILYKRIPRKKLFNLLKNKFILDLACGNGRYTFALSKSCKKIIGLDISKGNIKNANYYKKKFGVKNIIFKVGNALNVKYPLNSFDFVFCQGVAHHTNNPKKVIKECFRLTKPGGYIFFSLYGYSGIFSYARKRMNKIIKKRFDINTASILFHKILGIPQSRSIFFDNFFVPIEKHLNDKSLCIFFKKNGAKSIEKITNTYSYDIPSFTKNKIYRKFYGDGNLRYLIQK